VRRGFQDHLEFGIEVHRPDRLRGKLGMHHGLSTLSSVSALGRGPPLAAQAHLPPQDRMPTRDSTSCVAGFWEIIEPSM
jgi:hypothetical protein